MTLFPRPSSTPLGYAATFRPNGVAATAIELLIIVASLLLTVDQLFIVQPDLYLHDGTLPSKTLLRASLIACTTVGWLVLRLPFTYAIGLTSLAVAASGPMQFWAFGRGEASLVVAHVPAILGALALGAATRRTPKALAERAAPETFARVLLHPVLAVVLLFALCLVAVLSNAIGPLRASLATAGGLATAQILATERHAMTVGRWLGFIALGAYSTGAVVVEHFLPLHLVLTSSHPIVYAANSERCRLEISSGQGAYHLFVDSELRFSTFDEKRWADALVRPALARVRQPKRALVLSTGEGLIERNLLEDTSIESITSVVRCRLVADNSRHSAWLRRLTHDALNSPRVSSIERDPAAFLTDPVRERFDLIIVDLPDPATPRESKYYSRYFYRQLAARLEPGAVLVTQATSARRSPKTFATIGATIRAAGLTLQPGMVPLVSRGEWSLYLAAADRIPPVVRPEWLATSLAGRIPLQFAHPWPDTLAPADFEAVPSTLHDATVLDWFERESEVELPPHPTASATRGRG